MTTVPNWIANAVIVHPIRGREASLTYTKRWRATKTQVIVETVDGREKRFWLVGLTEVGEPKGFPLQRVHLAAPDAPEVIASRRASAVSEASWMVLGEVERKRLQDYTDDAEAMVEKLTAIRDAANAALASLVEFI